MTGMVKDDPVAGAQVTLPVEDRTICRLDGFGAWTGEWAAQPVTAGAPDGWVWADLPTLANGEVAHWAAGRWVVRPRDDAAAARAALAARKVALLSVVDDRRDMSLSAGFTPATGTLAGHTLQTRNADDKLNWLTSQAAYQAMVAGGHGGSMGAVFRTADNATMTLSFAEGLATLLAMAAWGSAVFGRSWALKDAITAAADAVALDTIDTTEGWPA